MENDVSDIPEDAAKGEDQTKLALEDEAGFSALIAEAHLQLKRTVEALLFASSEPLSIQDLRNRLPDSTNIKLILKQLVEDYQDRGVTLVEVDGKWLFRTAQDLSFLLQSEAVEPKKLSRAALETLAIIAYHQPVTRAEIEAIRGVGTSKGTLDVLMQTGWVRMRGRRRTPGRPVTYGTSEMFLVHFDLTNIQDLPGIEELKGAGMFDSALPPAFDMPVPDDGEELAPDEDPLDEADLLESVIEEEDQR